MEAPRSNISSAKKSHKLTEWGQRMLKCVAHENRLPSVASLTTEFQTASGSSISTWTVCQELYKMGFYGRAAAHHHVQCQASAVVVQQWFSSLEWQITLQYLAIWWTNLGLGDARRLLPTSIHSAYCKVWWRRDNGLGLSRPLSSSEGSS